MTPTPAAQPATWLLVAALTATSLGAACSRPATSPRRRPLEGMVVIDGVPAFSGVISLSPRAGHAGPVASAPIEAGRYAFTAANGPAAGPYRAVVAFVRDAAEARSFQPAYGKDRPPKPPSPPPPEAAAPKRTEPDAAHAEPTATDAVEPPIPPAPPPAPASSGPNMRAFDVEVPTSDPPRLDFTIDGGASS
jgi:hypothetical protein